MREVALWHHAGALNILDSGALGSGMSSLYLQTSHYIQQGSARRNNGESAGQPGEEQGGGRGPRARLRWLGRPLQERLRAGVLCSEVGTRKGQGGRTHTREAGHKQTGTVSEPRWWKGAGSG